MYNLQCMYKNMKILTEKMLEYRTQEQYLKTIVNVLEFWEK
jgi:hypothetical protein